MGKFFLGLPFFLITIVFRSISFSLVLCFLGWWSSIIIFLIFFITVLTAICIGDNFFRACVYGVWSFLVPVGYTKDPLEPLDYRMVSNEDSTVEGNAGAEESPHLDVSRHPLPQSGCGHHPGAESQGAGEPPHLHRGHIPPVPPLLHLPPPACSLPSRVAAPGATFPQG